ncbi:MAG: Lrp/AsnC family transcriptional regulator [Alphaproteobacteria bacterium]
MEKIDQIDRCILAEMQRDASLSLAALAERVGVSRNPCWRRMRSLQKRGLIRAQVALLEPKKLNLALTAFIAIRTDQHTPDWLDQFAAAVKDIPEIIGVFRLAGDIDYLIEAIIPDVDAYDALYQRLIARINLSDVSCSFVMQEIKRTTALPLGYA